MSNTYQRTHILQQLTDNHPPPRRQLLLLLRNHHLRRHRSLQLLRLPNHPRHRQRRVHFRRTVRRAKMRSSSRSHGGFRLDGNVLPRLRLCRPLRSGHGHLRIRNQNRGKRPHCLFLSVYRGFCYDLGSIRYLKSLLRASEC